MSLSMAQVPIWVAEMYRMFEKSNPCSAPSSEPPSSALSRASRSSRRRSNRMRSSESTAFVPNVAVLRIARAFLGVGRAVRRGSDENHSAFDWDDLTGDVVRVRSGEEERRRHDVGRLSGAAEQDARGHGVEALV